MYIVNSYFLAVVLCFQYPPDEETFRRPITYSQYFSGSLKVHFTGILGGMIWCVGITFSVIAAGKAGFAISYGLGQGATLVAALWGVFIWNEFKGSKGTTGWLATRFILFFVGIGLLIYAGLYFISAFFDSFQQKIHSEFCYGSFILPFRSFRYSD